VTSSRRSAYSRKFYGGSIDFTAESTSNVASRDRVWSKRRFVGLARATWVRKSNSERLWELQGGVPARNRSTTKSSLFMGASKGQRSCRAGASPRFDGGANSGKVRPPLDRNLGGSLSTPSRETPLSGEEFPRMVGTARERGLKTQDVIGGGQVGEADGVHALAQHVGEVLENRRQLQDGRFFTHSEPTPDDKGSED
jgi:hypothetical protein